MPCTNCSSSPLTFASSYFYSNQPSNCDSGECGTNTVNAKCVYYAGPNLSCSGIEVNDSLELALQKIDTQICSITGDYSTYSFGCIDDGGAITTEAQFVSAISSYACTTRSTLTTFTGTTFPAYQAAVNSRFVALEVPGITCATASVTSTDTLQAVLNKYCTKLGTLTTAISISGVDWDSCFTVVSPPTTIAGGFTEVLSQICQLKAAGLTLPTFNNTGTCLSSPGASDTLVSTIGKIITRLCQTPTLDNDNLTSSCISIPSADTDLETLLQSILTKVDALSTNSYTFSEDDFNITAQDEDNVCAGKSVALVTPINQDRFVATSSYDTAPGTLDTKVIAGTGISINTSNPAHIVINATGTDTDVLVKAASGDAAAGYLQDKMYGQASSGIALITSYNATTDKVDITPSVTASTLLDVLFLYLENNPASELKERFCTLVSSCPDPGNAEECTYYTVANGTGSGVLVTYNDCVSGSEVEMKLAAAGSIEFCARSGTVVCAGGTITPVAPCPGGVYVP